MDLVERMPEDSTARRHLEASIEERLIGLSYRDILSSAVQTVLFAVVVVAVISGVQVVAIMTSDGLDKFSVVTDSIVINGLCLIVIEMVVFAGAIWDRNATTKRRGKYFEDRQYPNVFEVRPNRITRAIKRRWNGEKYRSSFLSAFRRSRSTGSSLLEN